MWDKTKYAGFSFIPLMTRYQVKSWFRLEKALCAAYPNRKIKTVTVTKDDLTNLCEFIRRNLTRLEAEEYSLEKYLQFYDED